MVNHSQASREQAEIQAGNELSHTKRESQSVVAECVFKGHSVCDFFAQEIDTDLVLCV